MKFHQPGPSSLSTLDLNANVNIGRRRRRRTGDDISSSVLCTGELKMIVNLFQLGAICLLDENSKIEVFTYNVELIYNYTESNPFLQMYVKIIFSSTTES